MLLQINVDGCDDSTVFNIEATESEFLFLQKIAEKCTSTSNYGCMPVMSVVEVNPPAKEDQGGQK